MDFMTPDERWQPTHDDPLFIMAMDHRGSFGKTLFEVQDDNPTDEQQARMRAAKELIYAGLRQGRSSLTAGRPGVLVDEKYGRAVIERAGIDDVVLAVPVEASGHEWFTTEWGEQWLEHLQTIRPAYAKVLVRDNPGFEGAKRREQLEALAAISAGLRDADVPLLYELLVPGTDEQLETVGGDPDRYDRELRPDLVVRVIADNQSAGVDPTLWKVEGLESVDAARAVAEQARAGSRDADLIVLGRDAPAERVDRWLAIASDVDAFVGFAIGRSIWEDTIADWVGGRADHDVAVARIAERYAGFARQWR